MKDLSWFYLLRMGIAGKDKTKSNSIFVVDYVNKYIEYVNFRKVFTDIEVQEAAPFSSKHFKCPTVSYKYPPTIRSKVLNYKEAYNANIDPDALNCKCSTSEYADPSHKHIITGDLSMIDSLKLRNVLNKGLNYRDQVKPCTDKALKSIRGSLNKYCNKLSNLWNKSIQEFQEWKVLIIERVKKQLENVKPYSYYSILSDVDVKRELEKLHKDFVLVPTDKAQNNVTIVCKKFYLEMIKKELTSVTFDKIDDTEENIIERHEKFMLKHGIRCDGDNRKLPYLYITPKQHKNPIGLRYITSGSGCSLQQLSVYLSICLKSMLHSAKNRSLYDNKFHIRNDYFVIDDRDPVLEFINDSNVHGGFKSVKTYDFSTLYTSIPHSQLKQNMKRFVERVFDFKDKSFIVPNLYKKKAYFSDCSSKSKVQFSKDSLLECINYLIDNSFVKYDGCIYRQIIGIPMGTNAAPQVANVYLHVYEYEYIQVLIEKNDLDSLRRLKDIFRYQDDLIVFNDFGLIDGILKDIYPEEMIVNNTNISAKKCSYLDLSISIYRGKFRVTLYDKRNDYKFKVISYPFLDGNIPKNLSYGVFSSQLIRMANINTTLKGFKECIFSLVKKLVGQGFDVAALRNKFVKFYKYKINIWGKFGVDIYSHFIEMFNNL